MSCPNCKDTGFLDVSNEVDDFDPDKAYCACLHGDRVMASGTQSPWPKKRAAVRDEVADAATALWMPPKTLEAFEAALDANRAYTLVPRGRTKVWVRLIRDGPTRRFSEGKFSLKYRVYHTTLYGWFLPSDLYQADYPTLKIAPGEFVPFEEDVAAREVFGLRKIRDFREN